MANLWSCNTPAQFWRLQPEMPDEAWRAALERAVPILGLCAQTDGVEHLLSLVLGEGQFGEDHWRLSAPRRWYYALKPFLPRPLCYLLRRLHSHAASADFALGWPIEDRYARFQWELIRQLMLASKQHRLTYRRFWPEGRRYAFVLTHDVETGEGQAHVRVVADLEERLGFRSSFNFVPERYPLDLALIEELRERGFEIGVHGLKHDGKLFSSPAAFRRRAERINVYLKELNAVGFRSPLTMRNPQWMQALAIEYDLSFFDSDPFEPMPGGVMTIWPFMIGRFVELPYTLPQDCTLYKVLGERTPRCWLEKVDFVERYHGLALLNTHPDYLKEPACVKTYGEFLRTMQQREGYWHALPREAARWWRRRSAAKTVGAADSVDFGQIVLEDGGIQLAG